MRIASLQIQKVCGIWLLILLAFSAPRCVRADDTNAPAPTATPAAPESGAEGNQAALRSSLEIQDQLHSLQLASQKFRQESADALADLRHQLDLVQSNLNAQSVASLKMQQEAVKAGGSNSMLLEASLIFAGFGSVVLLAAAFLQWQMVGRFRALASNLSAQPALTGGTSPAALGMGENALLASQGLERSTAQFLSAIDRLEARIRDMEAETTAGRLHRSLAEGSDALILTNGSGTAHPGEPGKPNAEANGKSSLLLSKGQTLLKLDKPEDALACFDEALTAHPDDAEVLLAKGTALERLQRLNEAIECYDRAIASDGSMTMAYLHKGGVFNRMERYGEALECYEQALRSQEKTRVAESAAA